jgi:hypothetical protein
VKRITHFGFVYYAGPHNSNGGETLKRLAIGLVRSGRVTDKAIAGLETLQRGFLAMVELGETSTHSEHHM